MVGTGFQADVEIRTLRPGARPLERYHFGMIPPLVAVVSVSYDLAFSNHHRSDQRIGTHPSASATGQSNRPFHETLMFACRVFHQNRTIAHQKRSASAPSLVSRRWEAPRMSNPDGPLIERPLHSSCQVVKRVQGLVALHFFFDLDAHRLNLFSIRAENLYGKSAQNDHFAGSRNLA